MTGWFEKSDHRLLYALFTIALVALFVLFVFNR